MWLKFSARFLAQIAQNRNTRVPTLNLVHDTMYDPKLPRGQFRKGLYAYHVCLGLGDNVDKVMAKNRSGRSGTVRTKFGFEGDLEIGRGASRPGRIFQCFIGACIACTFLAVPLKFCFIGACIACTFLAVPLKFWPYVDHTDNVLKAVCRPPPPQSTSNLSQPHLPFATFLPPPQVVEGQLFLTLLLSIVLQSKVLHNCTHNCLPFFTTLFTEGCSNKAVIPTHSDMFSKEELGDDMLDENQYGTILVVALFTAPSVRRDLDRGSSRTDLHHANYKY